MSQSVTLKPIRHEPPSARDPHQNPRNVAPSQVEILRQAKQGDPEAIATLMNWVLQPKGITVRTSLDGDHLLVNLEAAHAPKQAALVAIISKGMKQLQAEPVRTLTVYGCQSDHPFPIWTQSIELQSPKSKRRSAQLMVIPSPAPILALDAIDLPDVLDDPDTSPDLFNNIRKPVDEDFPSGWRTVEPVDVLLLLLLPVTLTGLYAAYEKFPTRLSARSVLPNQRKTPSSEAALSAPEAVSDPEQSAGTYKPGPFEWSQRKAIVASRLVQVAQTSAEWELAASQWQEAVRYIESVPIDSAKQELVQSKLAEYQRKPYTQDQAAQQSGAIVGRLESMNAPLAIAPAKPQITKDAFSHLRFGASYEQVATLLGMPGEGI